MTESMKFGPEWLRNMSNDMGNNTSLLSGVGGGGGGTSSLSSSNINNSSTSSLSSTNNSTTAPLGPRYQLAEYRYGREEMLSLFDKNMKLPEILPSFKKLYVDKIQSPLALIPTTEDEITTNSTRPWALRTQVGTLPVRGGGGGRGGIVDRGRGRNRGAYHSSLGFQRPPILYDEEIRGIAKQERGWPERNGSSEIGNSNDWNGSPSSSPRKEYNNSHNRNNMENWRRNRIDDGDGDGWRSSAAVNNSTYRWSRSTSWRDDDGQISSGIGGSSGVSSGGDSSSGSSAITRSYSSSSAIGVGGGGGIGGMNLRDDRGGSGGGNGNGSSSCSSSSSGCSNGNGNSNSIGGSSVGGSSFKTSNSHSITQNGNNNHHNNNGHLSSLSSSNKQGGSSNSSQWDQDDMLPEWAMENPTDGGGSFDASGAFHAPNENCCEDDDDLMNNHDDNKSPDTINKESDLGVIENEHIIKEKDSKEIIENHQDNKHNHIELNKMIAESNKNNLIDDKKIKSDENAFNDETNNKSSQNKSFIHSTSNRIIEDNKTSLSSSTTAQTLDMKENRTTSTNVHQHQSIGLDQKQHRNLGGVGGGGGGGVNGNVDNKNLLKLPSNSIMTTTAAAAAAAASVLEISHQMKELSDNMVEKLIMDDELTMVTSGNRKLSSSNTVTNVSNAAAAAMLKTSKSNIPTPASMLQQQANLVNTPLMTPSVPPQVPNANELWYYRDPQGKVQGPFTASEMVEWYRAGYFDENLYVRRVCDARYAALGELVKMCGNSMPFLASHLIPPLSSAEIPTPVGVGPPPPPQQQVHVTQNSQPTNPPNMNVPKQNINPLISSNDLISLDLQLQMLQKQFLLRQQSIILSKLAATEPWSMLSPEQQQTLLNQHMSQIVLPDHLMSLSALSNSMSMVNPSTYMLQQMLAAAKNDINSIPKVATTNQQPPLMHNTLQSFGGGNSVSNGPTDFNNQSAAALHNLMQNNIPTQPNLSVQQPVVPTHHHNSTSLDNDPIKSLLLQLQMQKGGMPPTGAPTASSNTGVAPPGSGFPMPNKWSTNLSHQSQTAWGPVSSAGVVSGSSGNTAHVSTAAVALPQSMWDYVPLPQTKQAEMKTEQQIIEEQLQNEKMARQSAADFMKAIIGDRSELSDINEQQQKQQQNQQQQQLQHQSQTQLQFHLQQQQQQQQQQQHQQQQQLSNKKNDKSKVATEEKSHKGQKIDDESNKKAIKGTTGNKIDKKEAKKVQSEEEKKKELAEEKKKQKEEKRRQQLEEDKRRQQQQQEEEKRRQMLEEKKRLEDIEHHRRMKMLENATSTSVLSKPVKQSSYASSIAPWSNSGLPGITTPGPNFAEIQKAEMERRAEEQRLEQLLEHQRKNQLVEMMIQKEHSLKWNSPSIKSLNVKSLAEIQAEEHKRQQMANEQATVIEHVRRKDELSSSGGNGISQSIGGGINNSTFGSIWNNRPTQNIAWNGKSAWSTTSSSGFWEEPTKTISSVVASAMKQQQSSGAGTAGNPRALSKSQTISNMQSAVNKSNTSAGMNGNNNMNSSGGSNGSGGGGGNSSANTSGGTNANANNTGNSNNNANNKQGNQVNKQQSNNKSGKSGQNSKSNVTNNAAASKKDDARNEFTSWCIKTLSTMNSGVDVPTFIGFLQDIESPYEVKDYIRMYLGETKECTEFAKQFLERRSKYKNQQRTLVHMDDMCAPAPAINPSSNDFQEGKSKKIKKNKMTKLDTRILGFSVTAAQDRINVGDRDYGDAS